MNRVLGAVLPVRAESIWARTAPSGLRIADIGRRRLDKQLPTPSELAAGAAKGAPGVAKARCGLAKPVSSVSTRESSLVKVGGKVVKTPRNVAKVFSRPAKTV